MQAHRTSVRALIPLLALAPSAGTAASSLSAPLALEGLAQASQTKTPKAPPTPGPAQRLAGDLYLLADVGVALTLDADIDNIASTATTVGLSNAKISLDPGVRFDVGLGYEIYDWLAFEVETGLIWNGVKNVSGTVTDTNPPFFGFSGTLTGGSGGIYSVPIMFNLQARIPLNKDPLQPFSLVFGGGMGTIWSDADVNNVGLLTPLPFPIPVTASVNGSGWAFAYQANLGFEWSVARNVALGVRYAFLGTTQLNYGKPGFSDPALVGVSDIKVDALYTNAIMATLKIDF